MSNDPLLPYRLGAQQSELAKLFASPALRQIAAQQSDLARIFASPALKSALAFQQSELSKVFASPALRQIAAQQGDLAKVFASPALRQIAAQQGDLAKIFASPALKSALAFQQSELSKVFASPALQQIAAQQGDLAKVFASPALQQIAAQQGDLAKIFASPALRSVVSAFEAISARIGLQLAGLSLRPSLKLDYRVNQAARSWGLSARPISLLRAVEAPNPLSHLGFAVQGVNTAARELEPESADDAIKEEPWTLARAQETDYLIEWLAEVNPKLPQKFKGAWHAASQKGPDWISQAANSAVELIDWTLRSLAPDDLVLQWRDVQGQYLSEVGENGRPQRSLRIRYIAQARLIPASSVDLIVKATVGTMKDLQKLKHADDERMAASLRAALIALEHCLLMLRGPME